MSAVAKVSSAPSTGLPERLTAMMRGPKPSSMRISRLPMPPAPTTATVLSSKRKLVCASTSSRLFQLVPTRLCACNWASRSAMVDSATVASYSPAALDQRAEVFRMTSSRWSTPANGTWTRPTLGGRGCGKSSGPPLKMSTSASSSGARSWPAASRACRVSSHGVGNIAYFISSQPPHPRGWAWPLPSPTPRHWR